MHTQERWLSQGGQFKKKGIQANGKVIIITGCNTGIGKETALDLASRGAKVYMACRDSKRCEVARQDIIKQTGNNNVFNCTLDLSSFESIRNFVKKFLEEENRLDILINNAGVILPRTLTTDGYEMQIGVNHLGHFLLTNLLLETLKASAPSRIVVVSSLGHKFGVIKRDDLMSEKSYSTFKVYCQSKLANILFSRELSKRLEGTGVTINSLHPGAVKTELSRHASFAQILIYPFYICFKTPKSGAQTTLAVALDPDFEKVSGKYFSDCKIANESNAAKDDDTAKWLWEISEKLTGLSSVN